MASLDALAVTAGDTTPADTTPADAIAATSADDAASSADDAASSADAIAATLTAAKTGDLAALTVTKDETLRAVDAYGSNALHWAAGRGNLALVRHLVEDRGMDASFPANPPRRRDAPTTRERLCARRLFPADKRRRGELSGIYGRLASN